MSEQLQRLEKLQQRLDERGSQLRGVSWAPGAENLPVEERQKALADFMEAFLNGQSTPVYFLRDNLLSGEQLVEYIHKLEKALREVNEIIGHNHALWDVQLMIKEVLEEHV